MSRVPAAVARDFLHRPGCTGERALEATQHAEGQTTVRCFDCGASYLSVPGPAAAGPAPSDAELAAAAAEAPRLAGEAAKAAAKLAEVQRRKDAAEDAGWVLPRTVAALAFDRRDPQRLAGSIGPDVVAADVEGIGCAVVADPDAPGRRATIARALDRSRPSNEGDGPGTAPAAVGPTVAWSDAQISFARAADTLRLAREGLVLADGPIRAEDHAVGILLRRERRLVRDLAGRLLEPLDSLTPVARRRFAGTLLAWFRHRGRLAAVAAELHVHPQTVRYRLGRARELLGDILEDPDRRLELELALRAEELEQRHAPDQPEPVPGAATQAPPRTGG